MSRPKSARVLSQKPEVLYYKPQGVPLRHLQVIEITHEEWEALRLKNIENFDQTRAAQQMKTSQSTFQRILSFAQKKISTAIIKGMAIKIIQQE